MAYSKQRLSEEDKKIIRENAPEKTIPEILELITPGFTYGQVYSFCCKENVSPKRGKNINGADSYRSGTSKLNKKSSGNFDFSDFKGGNLIV